MRPLGDLRIIAVEQHGAGPFGSLQLADLGADVVKIEDPRTGGDIARSIAPFATGGHSLLFEALNRGKRSIALDLRSAQGQRSLHQLAGGADAVFSNLRGDVPQRLGLRYADLSRANPRIVCCALSAFGTQGPAARLPGYDYLIQGAAGWMSITGGPGAPPTRAGPSVVDWASGLAAALALLAGVHAARRDGRGSDCDVSMFDTAISFLGYLPTWHLSGGYEPQRGVNGAHPSLVPFQNFETRDGWIVVACPKQKFWLHLVKALDRLDLAADPRYESPDARLANAPRLIDILSGIFRRRSSEEWLTVLRAADVPCAPVNTVSEAVALHGEIHGGHVQHDHPTFGTVRHPVPLFAGTADVAARAPELGEHTDAAMRELDSSVAGTWPTAAAHRAP